jgi:hypothetical protein
LQYSATLRPSSYLSKVDSCVWQEHLAHFGGLIWPTLSH